MKLIHTDLKPENVLFKSVEVHHKECPDYLDDYKTERDSRDSSVSRSRSRSSSSCSRRVRAQGASGSYRVPVSSKIKVIDLGSAIFEDDHHSSVISTRHYRAPEVILRLGWSYPSDIWSIGCILLELFTGDTTFQTHHNGEHLAMMEVILGPFPQHILATNTSPVSQKENASEEQSPEKVHPKNLTIEKYFKKDPERVLYCVDFPQSTTSSRSRRRVRELKKLEEIVDLNEHAEFYDLIKRTLEYDPNKRIKASEALEHPFFNGSKK